MSGSSSSDDEIIVPDYMKVGSSDDPSSASDQESVKSSKSQTSTKSDSSKKSGKSESSVEVTKVNEAPKSNGFLDIDSSEDEFAVCPPVDNRPEKEILLDRAKKCIHRYPGCTAVNTIHCEECNDNFCANCDREHHIEENCEHHERVSMTWGLGLPYTSVVECGVCQGERVGEHSCDPLSRHAPGLRHLRKVNDDEDFGAPQKPAVASPSASRDTSPAPSVSAASVSSRKFAHECDVCGRTFNRPAKLKAHQDRYKGACKSETGNFGCDICGRTFVAAHDLAWHKKTCQGNEAAGLQCNTCGRTFNRPSKLRDHQNKYKGTCTPKTEDTKSVSGMSASSVAIVPSKIGSRKGPKKSDISLRTCDLCGQVFDTAAKMKAHRGNAKCKRASAAEADATPSVSASSVSSSSAPAKLGKPQRRKSDASTVVSKTFSGGVDCDICGKTFSSAGKLREHQQKTNGKCNNPCDICGKTFSTMHNLRQHLKTVHEQTLSVASAASTSSKKTNVAPVLSKSVTGECKCDMCGKTFSRPEDLARHKKVTAGNCKHKFQCQDCGKTFTRASSLKNHVCQVDKSDAASVVSESAASSSAECLACAKIAKGYKPNQPHTCGRARPESSFVLTCHTCDKTFSDRYSLKRHQKNGCPGPQKKKTSVPSEAAASDDGECKQCIRERLGKGRRYPHTCERGYDARRAAKREASASAVAQSECSSDSSSESEKPEIKCETCGQLFNRMGKLKVHQENYKGLCDRVAIYRQQLDDRNNGIYTSFDDCLKCQGLKSSRFIHTCDPSRHMERPNVNKWRSEDGSVISGTSASNRGKKRRGTEREITSKADCPRCQQLETDECKNCEGCQGKHKKHTCGFDIVPHSCSIGNRIKVSKDTKDDDELKASAERKELAELRKQLTDVDCTACRNASFYNKSKIGAHTCTLESLRAVAQALVCQPCSVGGNSGPGSGGSVFLGSVGTEDLAQLDVDTQSDVPEQSVSSVDTSTSLTSIMTKAQVNDLKKKVMYCDFDGCKRKIGRHVQKEAIEAAARGEPVYCHMHKGGLAESEQPDKRSRRTHKFEKCAKHRCTLAPLNVGMKKEAMYCEYHQRCDVTGCYHDRHIDSTFCLMHQDIANRDKVRCIHEGCQEEVHAYGKWDMLWTCEKHAEICNEEGCQNYVSRGNTDGKCEDHGGDANAVCAVYGCGAKNVNGEEPATKSNSTALPWYCVAHRCKAKNCHNKATNQHGRCDEHLISDATKPRPPCSHPFCQSDSITGIGGFCGRHGGKKVCIEPMCTALGRFEGGRCQRHATMHAKGITIYDRYEHRGAIETKIQNNQIPNLKPWISTREKRDEKNKKARERYAEKKKLKPLPFPFTEEMMKPPKKPPATPKSEKDKEAEAKKKQEAAAKTPPAVRRLRPEEKSKLRRDKDGFATPAPRKRNLSKVTGQKAENPLKKRPVSPNLLSAHWSPKANPTPGPGLPGSPSASSQRSASSSQKAKKKRVAGF